MKNFWSRFWRVGLLATSVLGIPLLWNAVTHAYVIRDYRILLLIAIGFSLFSVFLFRVLRLTVSLQNVLLFDLVCVCFIVVLAEPYIRRQIWISAVVMLAVSAAVLLLQVIGTKRIPFTVKGKIQGALLACVVLCLGVYNSACVWQRQAERNSGTTTVKASYFYYTIGYHDPSEPIPYDDNFGWISTRAALEGYYSTLCSFQEMDRSHDGHPSFRSLMEKYDDRYFQSHSLQILTLGAGSSSLRYQAEELYFKSSRDRSPFSIGARDNRINLYYRVYAPPTLAESQLSCDVLLELPKASHARYYGVANGIYGSPLPVSDEFIREFDRTNSDFIK